MRLGTFRALSEPWAIESEDALREIIEISERAGEGPEAVAAKIGRRLENTFEVSVRDGVAIVPMIGPIFRYANIFTDISGGTPLDTLARDFTAAIEDPAVQAVLLEIDSPGGQANGVSELANMVFAARGRKPVVAFSGGTIASGAFWIGAAADELVVGETARVGSVGVVAAVIDRSRRNDAMGVREMQFVSSNAPNKRPDLATDEGRAVIQKEIDSLEARFVAALARFRGVDEEAVLGDFGRGGILIGSDAVSARMADRVDSFEATLARLAAARPAAGPGRTTTRSASMDENAQDRPAPERQPEALTVERLRSEHPAIAAALIAEGQAQGAAEERARCQAIDEATLPGLERLAAEAKAEGVSADDFRQKVIAAAKDPKFRALADLKADAPAALPSGDGQPAGVPRDAQTIAAKARELVDAEAKAGRQLSYAEACRRVAGPVAPAA